MENKAIVIIGAVVSGKTTLANRLSKVTGSSVINEENVGNYFEIINNISSKNYPNAIYEHCYLYTQSKLFSVEYQSVSIVFLKVANNILKENHSKRLQVSKKGDFVKINPLLQQEQIEQELKEWVQLINKLSNVNYLQLNIESKNDYKACEKKLAKVILKNKFSSGNPHKTF